MIDRRLGLVLAVLALAGADANAQVVGCDVRLNVTDQDPAGLNVRAAPGGAVVAALKAKDRWVQAHVTGQDGAWARIDRATFISEDNPGGTVIFHSVGWVAFSKLGIEELNEQAQIRAAPSPDARVLLTMPHTDGPAVAAEALGCDGMFLKVKVSGVVGWTQSFCSNQFTTCN
jgi:hypothetical protein